MKDFLDFVLAGIEKQGRETRGYQFDTSGRIEIIGSKDPA
jgi:hypothetical protein